jgi:hypothetical protein
VAYIVMSIIKSALCRVLGVEKIESQFSGYYMANEISSVYNGMMIAIDQTHWKVFYQMEDSELGEVLIMLAANVKLSAFQKHLYLRHISIFGLLIFPRIRLIQKFV